VDGPCVVTAVGWASRVNHDFIVFPENGREIHGKKGDYIFMSEDTYSLSHLISTEFNQTYQRFFSTNEIRNILTSANLLLT